MKPFDKETIHRLMKEGQLTDASNIFKLLNKKFEEILEEMHEAELDQELGYSKYDYKNKVSDSCRNENRKITACTDYFEVENEVPRDRENEFEPIVMKKNQKDVSGLEDKILSMYAKGMTVQDIKSHLNEIYGINASPSLISNITDKILQSRNNGHTDHW